MKTHGYIHLHRSLLSWPYHNNPSMLTVWTHLLMLAEYEDCQHEGVTIRRGELLISQQWLAEYLGISEKQLRLCLQKLEEGKEITKRRANGRTLITILKYNDYQAFTSAQPSEETSHTPTVSPEKRQQKGDMERNIKNNKNLSDGEIDGQAGMAGKAGTSGIPGQSGMPGKSGISGTSCRRSYTLQLDASEAWKHKCCRDYHIEPSQISRHILAFHECLLREQPNKTWLSFEDFCRHFHSWLRFQTPESIRRYCGFAVKRRQQQIARKAEEERQQQMWKEIEETKSRAVSYEEYKRNRPLPLAPSPIMGRGKNML